MRIDKISRTELAFRRAVESTGSYAAALASVAQGGERGMRRERSAESVFKREVLRALRIDALKAMRVASKSAAQRCA